MRQHSSILKVYRITHKKWADKLVASGYAARWNSHGFYVIYTAENRSLACLENLFHRNGFGSDNDYFIMTINIPNTVVITKIETTELPAGWNLPNENAHLLCRSFGDNWIKSQKSCCLIVPSAIIENEKNILINPNHKDFDKVKLSLSQPFSFDNRLSI